jgi:hypothetical protein
VVKLFLKAIPLKKLGTNETTIFLLYQLAEKLKLFLKAMPNVILL